MKNKMLIIFFTIIFSFISISSVSASSKIIKTETKDKVIFVQDNKGAFNYSWSFDKVAYNNKGFEFDLGIKFKSPNKNEINELIDVKMKKEYVSFNYHGTLPSTATVKVPVSKFKDGDKLNLYYYNDKTKKIETIKSNIMVMNGYVSFDIDHCSDYFLTMSIVKEASGANNNGVIIIGMIVIIVGLIGYTMFKNKK